MVTFFATKILFCIVYFNLTVFAGTLPDTIPFDFNAHGLADFRYINADANTSWLDQGLGVYRYGGN
jgi:hypothetical protein